MPRTDYIELGERRNAVRIPILFEDRSVTAVDKPARWMLVPFSWQRTPWNLQAAITSAIRAGCFWSRSRNLKCLQFIHRLDAETTGVLLFGKSPGAVETFGDLFESRRMEKRYLAVVEGAPGQNEWSCDAALAPDAQAIGRVKVDPRRGKEAVTGFRLLESRDGKTLLEARPWTGRTHQIRVHLAHSGLPIVGDSLYGGPRQRGDRRFPMGLRAVELAWRDPFRKHPVRVRAPEAGFLAAFGFAEKPPGQGSRKASTIPHPRTEYMNHRLRARPHPRSSAAKDAEEPRPGTRGEDE